MELVVFLQLLFLVLLGEGANSQSTTNDIHFVGVPYRVTINQNDLQGKVLLSARCAHINGSINTPGNFHYSLLMDNQYTNRFSINSQTGAVSLTVNALDIAEESTWSPIILCSDQSSSTNNGHPTPTSIELAVLFELENKYPPTFNPPGQINVTLREDQTFPYDIVVLNATDKDLGVCGEIKLSIDGRRQGPFRIQQSGNMLSLFSQLDYETSTNYTLTIRATNVQSSCVEFAPTSATIIVYISVENINDESPVFAEHQQVFQFNETTMPQNFVQLSCHDPDTPPSGIIYTEQYPLSDNPFRIDHQSGIVSAIEKIDYEVTTFYQLRFACIDSLNQKLRDETLVSIEVLPVNEYIPRVDVQSFFCEISELTPPGTLIGSTSQNSGAFAVYQATDPDRGLDHGEIMYRFSRNNRDLEFVNKHFNLDNETGDLTINAPFEYNSCNSSANNIGLRLVTVRITVCDRFATSSEYHECPSLHIRILITPSDCIPTFLKNQTVINVVEGTPIGTRLRTLPCDVRGQRTSERTIEIFSLDRNVLSTFTLEDDTIVLQKNLDYENTQNYSFFLECSDDTNSNVASVYVQVIPENDNTPYFEKNLFVFYINSSVVDSKVAYTLGNVQAFDDDLETGNKLQYSISVNPEMGRNDDKMEYFSVDTTSGDISVNNSVKSVGEDTLVFDVSAFDGNFTAKSSVLVKLARQECSNICSESHNVFIAVGLLTFITVILTLILLATMVYACYNTRQTKVRTQHHLNHASTTYELPTGYASLQQDQQMQSPSCSKLNVECNPAKVMESSLDFPEKREELDYHYVTPNTFLGKTTFGHSIDPQNYLAPSTAPVEMDGYLVMRPTFKSTLSGTDTKPMTSSSGENPSSLPILPPAPPDADSEQPCQSPLRRYSVENIYEHIQ